jgi:hypothetical protein
MNLPLLPTTLVGVIIYLVGLVILWAIVSIPVYFAGKAVTGGKSDFGDAMGATLGGAIGYFVVYIAVSYFLGTVIGSSASALALILALVVWLAVYRAAFRTSWIRAVGIVILSWVFLLILDYIAVNALGVSFPNFIPF